MKSDFRAVTRFGVMALFLLLTSLTGIFFYFVGQGFFVNALSPPTWAYVLCQLVFSSFYLGAGLALGYQEFRMELVNYLNFTLFALYSYLLFGVSGKASALFVLLTCLCLTFFVFKAYIEKNTLAGMLLLPYVFWLSFLFVLTYSTALFG